MMQHGLKVVKPSAVKDIAVEVPSGKTRYARAAMRGIHLYTLMFSFVGRHRRTG